jgi:cystathionine beta-lyase/cystathionine gamma-synthase
MTADIADYLDPTGCPAARPSLDAMASGTRQLHRGIDQAIRESGVPYLHPSDQTIMLDLLGSRRMVEWQESKASFVFEGDGCWSELPQVYARYGVQNTRQLLAEVRTLEEAPGAVLTDCGMQACALLFDVLVRPRSHAVLMQQVYNKTRKYLELLCQRLGAEVTVVEDGDYAALEAAVRENTVLIFAETFTNPLMRAVDPERLGRFTLNARKTKARGLRLIVDNTIASPWSLKQPLLNHEGIDFVVASGTKSLGGQDRDLWGYIASKNLDVLNELMDLQAMRGGILDWRRAKALLAGLPAAQSAFVGRCESAARVAAFLQQHPKTGEVFHPSLPDHPDRRTIDTHYKLSGSLLSFRLKGADEETTKHFADVLATCSVPRYALSFDGLATKVNHHFTVSEYFTPVEELERMGIDRLVRLGIGIEAADDIMACLNWALWHYDQTSPQDVLEWQAQRARDLGISSDNISNDGGGDNE